MPVTGKKNACLITGNLLDFFCSFFGTLVYWPHRRLWHTKYPTYHLALDLTHILHL